MDGQGNLEKTLKVREKSGNLKINSYSRQSSQNLFILFKREKHVLSHEIVWAHLPPPLGSKFFPLRVTLKFEVIQLAPLNLSIKMDFFCFLSEGMENCEMSEENQGKVREFWDG